MGLFRLAALLVAIVFAAPAHAEFVIAKCAPSSGCTCRLADLTVADFVLLTGAPAPRGARDMTLVHVAGADPYWTGADRTDVNVTYGGSGQCDVQLFDATAPEDGNWAITADPPDLSACPMLQGKMPAGAALSGASRKIAWGGTFHPSRLSDAGGPPVDWRKVGGDSWRGTLFDEKRGSTAAAKVVHGMRLASPRLVRGWSLFEFHLDVPAEQAAAMRAMGVPMQCRSLTNFTARRTS